MKQQQSREPKNSKSKFSTRIVNTIFFITLISLVGIIITHNNSLSLSAYNDTRGGTEIDLNLDVGENSQYVITTKGEKDVCEAGKNIQSAEECIDAASQLGIQLNDIVPIVKGNWNRVPRGCFTSGGALYFSSDTDKASIATEEFWDQFSLICRVHAVEGSDNIFNATFNQDSNNLEYVSEYFLLDEKESLPKAGLHETSTIKLDPHKKYNYPADPTREDDKNCIFLNSSIYRSIYVYPNWMNETDGWHGPILNHKNKNVTKWPWLELDYRAREEKWGQYAEKSNEMGQYSLELIVRDLITHPDSCLRTMDPMKATLFYVPYLPTTEFHNLTQFPNSLETSPYAQAIESAIDGKYGQWEHYFGLTSEFWKRKRGADHILVFPEPLHGLSHTKGKRGSFHYIFSQKMLSPAIILTTEISKTFVEMYPKCSSKNILAPYPEIDSNWYNGLYDKLAFEKKSELFESKAYLEAEKRALSISSFEVSSYINFQPKPVAQYYAASYVAGGKYGPCRNLLINMHTDYKCTISSTALKRKWKALHYGMRLSTFCPCPGGYSASSKRIYDAVNAGCIPVMLSGDTIWPFTTDVDTKFPLDPSTFSLRWDTEDFIDANYDKDCKVVNSDDPKGTFQDKIEKVGAQEIARLREGLKEVSKLYSYWSKESFNQSKNPLLEGILPDGGASMAIVKLLGERAGGSMWPDCQEELEESMVEKEPNEFKC